MMWFRVPSKDYDKLKKGKCVDLKLEAPVGEVMAVGAKGKPDIYAVQTYKDEFFLYTPR